MKQIIEMQADLVYLIRSTSVANSSYVENQAHCKLFLEILDDKCGQYLKLIKYQFNRDGVALTIQINSEDEVMAAYLADRAKSKTDYVRAPYTEVWRVISERMRILLSTFVKAVNRLTGRKGGKVRENFERYVFSSVEEALAAMKQLKTGWHDMSQPLKRYRPRKRLCKLRKKLLQTSVYVCSGALMKAGKMVPEGVKMGLRCLVVGVMNLDVLRTAIEATLHHHFPT